ncbi:MAG: alpha/beta hydrolase [Verrucomicrobiales bacterium]
MKFKLRWAAYVLLVPAIPLLPLVGCQHKIIYFPRPYDPMVPRSFVENGGQTIEANTGQGKQTAWLRLPKSLPAKRLWLVCAGNASLALEMRDVIQPNLPPEDAVLYFDYPGYGACQGSANPARLRESLKTILPLATKASGIPESEISDRVVVFGHSLGAAVGLIAASEFGLKRAVLVSPFSSSMDMAEVMLGLPLGFIVTHRFDNRKRLAELAARGGDAWIIHGKDDDIIPASMGSELAAIGKDAIHLVILPGAGHNDIFDVAPHAFTEAMTRIIKDQPVVSP